MQRVRPLALGAAAIITVVSAQLSLLSADAGSGGLSAQLPAAFAPTGPVSTTPVSYTPYLDPAVGSQTVQQLVQCGTTMYAVGSFRSIKKGSTFYSRNDAFSFSATTGTVTNWNPNVNGSVHSVALSADCSTAYLGGTFSSVHGTTAQNVVAVDTTTGAVRPAFAHSANNPVLTVQLTHGQVLVGGLFTSINGASRSKLASLNPVSGAPTAYANLQITGTYPTFSTSKVYNSQLSHTGTRMLIEGVFTSIDGQARQQVAMLDLGASTLTVDAWHADQLKAQCVPNESFYAKGANWAADDGSVYIATTGYHPDGVSTSGPRTGLCDAVAAFPASAGAVSSKWINYAGCDSLYSVVADASAVYVGGHQRWLNNGFGCDYAGVGAVSRPGIGAVSPSTGQALSWNPTRARGHGAEGLLLTTAGLWIASDNGKGGKAQQCGGLGNHGGICFLPY